MSRRPNPHAEAIVAAYQAGATTRAIGAQLGVTPATVPSQLRRAGIVRRPTGRRPTNDVPALIAAYQAGATVSALSRRDGITPMTVYNQLARAGIPLRTPLLGHRLRYTPLVRYLSTLPPPQQTMTLSFAQIEVLVGPLPVTARVDSNYWSSGAVARRNWRQQGFTATLDRVACAVTFTRRP